MQSQQWTGVISHVDRENLNQMNESSIAVNEYVVEHVQIEPS